ncbi:MAG: phosphocholine cytidylyltransferase family protein [Spirochaetota bacterium]
MKIVILAAGSGTRLGKPFPKCLTPLASGQTILERQLTFFSRYVSPDDICIVVGFEKEKIMDIAPESIFVFNREYASTNTSKSLLRAFKKLSGNDILWINGDVVFDPNALDKIIKKTEENYPFVVVNTQKVSEEEVKYRLDSKGNVVEISKSIKNGAGEALGINYMPKNYCETYIRNLEKCDNRDYFEKGLELAILHEKLPVKILDISEYGCVEVDFPEDLEQANKII